MSISKKIVGSQESDASIRRGWINFIRSNVYHYGVDEGDLDDRPFRVSASSYEAGKFTLARFNTTNGKANLVRTNREIACDAQERFAVYLPLRGELEFSQFGRNARIAPRSMIVLSSAEPVIHTKMRDNDTLIFLLPRDFVEQRLLNCEDFCIRPVNGNEGLRQLFHDTLLAFGRDADAMDEADFIGASRVIAELALLAFSGEKAEFSNERTVRAANLARVKRIMRRRLKDSDLTLPDIARESGISLRYLHDLFRDEERSAREHLIMLRLQYARQLLEKATGLDLNVTDVCMMSGFGNPSHFSTAFRRAFGVSPRDILRHG